MKKGFIYLFTTLLILSLSACKQVTSETIGSEETSANSFSKASSADSKGSNLGYEYKFFDSMEAFMDYMEKTDFDKDGFFCSSDAPYDKYKYEDFYMLRADQCYYVPVIEAKGIALQEISIEPSGLIQFHYTTGNKNEILTINIPTDVGLRVDEKSVLSMAEETTKGYAPDTIWSAYSTLGSDIAISSQKEIAFTVGNYLVKMYAWEQNANTNRIEYKNTITDYYEVIAFERINLN